MACAVRHPLGCLRRHSVCPLPDEDFNVSGAFVAVPAVNSNHLSHTGNDFECGTLERKRPLSMTVMEGDLLKKER